MARHGKQKANEETVPAAAVPQLGHNGGPPLTPPISATLVEFATISGLGETTIYRLIREGELESILVGRRRVVIVASYLAYLERQRAAQGFQRYPTPWATAPAGSPSRDIKRNFESPPTRRRQGSAQLKG